MELGPFEQLCQLSRERRLRAERYNVCAGETCFPVPELSTLRATCRVALAGARNKVGISENAAAALLFPEPDPEKVKTLLAANPDQVEVLGTVVPVEYRVGCAPRVTLRNALQNNAYRNLPKGGLKLPGGRPVDVWVLVDPSYGTWCNSTDVCALIVQVRTQLNERQWKNWPQGGRPAISLPDPAAAGATVAPVVETSYGVSDEEGVEGNVEKALMAFGTVAVNENRWSSDSCFKVEWFRNRAEADTANAAAVAKLAELQKAATDRAEYQQVIVPARALRDEAQRVYGALANRSRLNARLSDLQDQVYQRAYSRLSEDLAILRAWLTETEELLKQTAAALNAWKLEQEELETVRREAEDLQEKARRAYEEGFSDLSARLQQELSNFAYGRVPDQLLQIRPWMDSLNATLQKVDEYLKAKRERQAQDEAKPAFVAALDCVQYANTSDRKATVRRAIELAQAARGLVGDTMAARVLRELVTSSSQCDHLHRELTRRLPGLRESDGGFILEVESTRENKELLCAAAAWLAVQAVSEATAALATPRPASAASSAPAPAATKNLALSLTWAQPKPLNGGTSGKPGKQGKK